MKPEDDILGLTAEVRAEIEAIKKTAGAGATDWQMLLAAVKRSAQLRSTLREYLSYSSIDGRAEREPLRNKLKALLGNE